MPGTEANMPTWEMSSPDDGARVEIADPNAAGGVDLHLSETVMQQIRVIEESVVTAEQRVGLFRVG